MKNTVNNKFGLDEKGFYGEFGGAFIPEMLFSNVHELKENYRDIISSDPFQREFKILLKNYVGRPTPLYFSFRLSKKYNCKIYIKREDLNHTGAHKINNTIGQGLLAKYLGKKRIIAETGAGQHGVATATVCALMNLPCVVYMGEKDMERQSLNVSRMKMLGAEVRTVTSGSRTLKDATNEAIRDWINNGENTHYIIGSVVGPHPYPDMVARFQSIISAEIRNQLVSCEKTEFPEKVIACVGGGSNAAGTFYHFLDNEKTELIGVEAAGKGCDTNETAATITNGSPGILHGCNSYLLQDNYGQVLEAHSISAGLDYPGVGPFHSFLHECKRAKYISVTDDEALLAAKLLATSDGIIPALESAHAFAALEKIAIRENEIIVICLSGRGDKDVQTYNEFLKN